MNNLQIFKNEQFGEIRVIVKNEEPWFVASDACRILEIANTTQALERLDEDERSMFNIGRQGDTNIVNEPGLYSLVLGSRKPEAKAFKRWLTHEVLPAIRKTGTYSIPALTSTTRPHYRARMISTAVKDADNTSRLLQKMFGIKEGIAQATAFKMVESAYGLDMTPVKQAIPAAKHEIGYLTPTEIGMRMGGRKASEINTLIADLGLQIQEVGAKGKKGWKVTDTGKDYGEAFPYDAKTGHSGYQIKWNENVVSLLAARDGVVI